MSDLVERAKAALEGVSRGPWKFQTCGHWRHIVMTPNGCVWNPNGGEINSDRDGEFIAAARTLVPDLVAEVEQLREVLSELVDEDPCWFDHNGDCQAHGFFEITPDNPCGHEKAKRLLAGAE